MCRHSDKIRMQVRHIGSDGKVYIDSDSFLPSTLIGNQVTCFSQPDMGASYHRIDCTVEALGAIHFVRPYPAPAPQALNALCPYH